MINQDRNTFAALMMALGHADVLISGVTRPYVQALRQLRQVLDPKPDCTPFGIHILVGQSHTVFMADTTVTERPTAEQLAEIAIQTAGVARRMGHEPRVAFLSYSTFGNPEGTFLENIRDAVRLLDEQGGADFEYEGEMAPDVALNPAMHRVFPFSRLTGPANVLVMPGLHAAHILTKAVPRLTSGTAIGPLLMGLSRPVQIVPMDASVTQLMDMACLAAHAAISR